MMVVRVMMIRVRMTELTALAEVLGDDFSDTSRQTCSEGVWGGPSHRQPLLLREDALLQSLR